MSGSERERSVNCDCERGKCTILQKSISIAIQYRPSMPSPNASRFECVAGDERLYERIASLHRSIGQEPDSDHCYRIQ